MNPSARTAETNVCSPLELWHPLGAAPRQLLIGSNLPASLGPTRPAISPSRGLVDLAILAPTAAECRSATWLTRAVERLRTNLATDGIVYVAVPRRWRLLATQLLRRAKLVLGPPVLHLPNWRASHYLVRLTPPALRYALLRLIPSHPLVRRLVAEASRLPLSIRLGSLLLPGIALLGRPEEGPAAFRWLTVPGRLELPPAATIVSRSWRGNQGPVVVHAWRAGEIWPSVVAKVVPAAQSDRSVGEANILTELADGARTAGTAVPTVTWVGRVANSAVLVETGIQGTAVAALLAAQPDRLKMVLRQVVRWLAAWNRASRVECTLNENLIEREIIGPAHECTQNLADRSRYLKWLEAECQALRGTQLGLVATHGDLTMSNLLLSSNGRLGVVDWEAAKRVDLPLTDLFYAVVDAVLATGAYTSRLAAWQASFELTGAWATLVASQRSELEQAAGISPRVSELIFQACWLRHAVAELRRGARPGDGSFLDIAGRLIAQSRDVTSGR